jgi:2-dehydropantoate 2-reductase
VETLVANKEVYMPTDKARLLVIGAGVNGSICAAGLHHAGFDVTVLARGQRYAELLAEGMVIEDQLKKVRTVTRVPLIDRLEPADRYDYILVVVRRSQVRDLLPSLAQNVSPNVVFMVNNLAGPDEFTQALGKERVLLGFVFGAGRREGSIIRALVATGGWLQMAATPFGEVNGAITPRLTRLVVILKQAGFHAKISRQIVDWQASHAVLLPSFALPIMRHHLDTRALANSDADLRLMVASIPEALDVLQAAGYHCIPRANSLVRYIPQPLMRTLLRMALPTRFVEMGGVWHISQAPDEMIELARELNDLVQETGLPVPAVRKLLELIP